MIREQTNELFPSELRERLEASPQQLYVRSTMLAKEASSEVWRIVGCVVRPAEGSAETNEMAQHEYPGFVLLRDVLEGSQCVSFIEGLMSLSGLHIATKYVSFNAQPQTEVLRVAVKNYWMEEAGSVFTFNPRQSISVAHERLLVAGEPYYPDPEEAARDWLNLRVRNSDTARGKVLFLLPERRGYIADFTWPSAETLELHVAGQAVASEKLHVMGAYWTDEGVEQLAAPVEAGRASVKVGLGANRLDFFVVGANGRVYENHSEQLRFGAADCRFLGARFQHDGAAAHVLAAAASGEGPNIEFKEWVDFEGELKTNTKLMQVLRTVAAFANTAGGTLFVGIDDWSEIIGINTPLGKWAKTQPGEEAARRYVGALRSRVNDSLHEPTAIEPAVAFIEGKLVGMLHVAPSDTAVSIGTEAVLYMRKGATNAKVAPKDWAPKRSREHWGQ